MSDGDQGYLFFWGGVLSQWTRTIFFSNGYEFNCCEQYMMARKAWLFGDKQTLKQIMQQGNPKQQKALGRRVRGFDQKRWDRAKFSIVVDGNSLRAAQDKEFRNALLASGDRVIVEASPYDRVWGIGFDEGAALRNKKHWGQNLLGKALMQVRKELQKEVQND